MISHSTMISMLPADIRGRLRGTPEDPQLRELARMFIEDHGDCCPTHAFASAVDAWVRLGCPDPTPTDPVCPHCNEKLATTTVIVDGELDSRDVLRCEGCDTWYGPRWSTDPALAEMVHGHGTIAGL